VFKGGANVTPSLRDPLINLIILRVPGIVLLDGKTDDELESKALMNAINLVDIYGGSWGPKDDGQTVDGPGVLGQMSFEIGATQVYINATTIIQ